MKKIAVLLFVSAFLIIASCSQKSVPKKSDTAVAPAKVVTGYASVVKQLIQAKCAPCHIPSAGGNKTPLDNYDGAKKMADEIIRRVELNPGEKGYMPFKRDKLSAEEIAVFKQWRDDGLAE
ncbi:MAG: hypothetical protein GC171_00030 [Terrimonas sp.]|nr:hypothetical protein [Terrimonas sp.]